jgi:hypothetical protein
MICLLSNEFGREVATMASRWISGYIDYSWLAEATREKVFDDKYKILCRVVRKKEYGTTPYI